MRQRSGLSEWFHEAFGLTLADLPWLAIPAFAVSLAVPLLAWHLQRRQVITPGSQRLVEVAWLAVSTLVAAISWAIWAIDDCGGNLTECVNPVIYGVFPVIVLAVFSSSGVRQWRVDQCLVPKYLPAAILAAATHTALFCACSIGAAFVALSILIPEDAPLAAVFLPGWVFHLILSIGVSLYLLVAVVALPAILNRWGPVWMQLLLYDFKWQVKS